MRLAQLGAGAMADALRSQAGLGYRIGPFRAALRSDVPALQRSLPELYAHYEAVEAGSLVDFRLSVTRAGGLRRHWHPQVHFALHETRPFAPFPADTALPLMEWGSNWCVAHSAHALLMLHAGAVERGGQAALLAAWPGSGKSTLCAALDQLGWRLLSDEFGLVDTETLEVLPYPRLVPLKNEAIDVFASTFPGALLGPRFEKTRKGTVAHYRPTLRSIALDEQRASPRWLLFPSFGKGKPAELRPLGKEQAFLKLTGNAFNYHLLGEVGFRVLVELISRCETYLFSFGSIESAVRELEDLMPAAGAESAVERSADVQG